MISNQFNFNFYHFNELSSTNSYALEAIKRKELNEGAVIYADYQNLGKGQQGNKWESEKAKNLLMSLMVCPKVKVENRFLISQCVALGIKNYLDSLSVGVVQIKWPNDILVNRQKIAGILIENMIEGAEINTSVIGIGLNVNQLQFSNFKRKATSLSLLLNIDFIIYEVMTEMLAQIKQQFIDLDAMGKSYIQTHYLQNLYGFKESLNFEDFQGKFRGRIAHIDPDGMLQLWRNGRLCAYDLKEIQFID